MIVLSFLSEKLYLLKRFGSSLFTYNCVCCEKAVRGKCLCESCAEKLLSSGCREENFSFAYYYEGPAREVLLRYKFGGDYEFCLDALCDWLSEGFSAFSKRKIDAVVPVPSYNRKNTRLSELVEKFALMEGLPFKPELLKKTRSTKKQHDIPYEERLVNLAGAFEADSSVSGKVILLVDDIRTTGSTVSECSKAFLEKGAKEVLVLTVFSTRLK